MKTHKQMNWKACYDQGLAEGYFSKYKSYKTLKNTFNERKKNDQAACINNFSNIFFPTHLCSFKSIKENKSLLNTNVGEDELSNVVLTP